MEALRREREIIQQFQDSKIQAVKNAQLQVLSAEGQLKNLDNEYRTHVESAKKLRYVCYHLVLIFSRK